MRKILLTLLLSAPLLVAQTGDVHFEAVHVGMGGHQSVKDYLSLSDDQIQRLQDLRREQFERLQPSMQALAETQRALDEALAAVAPDPAVIGQLTLELRKHREAMPNVREVLREMALGILDSSQLAKLDALEEALKLQPTAQQAVSLNLLNPSYGPMAPGHMAWFEGPGDRTMSLGADADGPKHKAVFIQRGTVGAVSVPSDVTLAVPSSPTP